MAFKHYKTNGASVDPGLQGIDPTSIGGIASSINAITTHQKDNVAIQFESGIPQPAVDAGNALSASANLAVFYGTHAMPRTSMMYSRPTATGVELRDYVTESGYDSAEHAAQIVLAAASNPKAYSDAAMSPSRAPSDTRIASFESAYSGGVGGVDGLVLSTEDAFGTSPLRKFIGQSVELNMSTATTRPAQEMNFPTVNLDPDTGGHTMSISMPFMYDGWTHTGNGAPLEVSKNLMLNLYRDGSALCRDSLRLVNQVAADGSNAKYYVPSNVIAPWKTVVGNREVTTSHFRLGEQVNLITTGRAGTSVEANATQIDQLDGVISVSEVSVSVGEDLFIFETLNMNGAEALPLMGAHDKAVGFSNSIRVQLNKHTRPIRVVDGVRKAVDPVSAVMLGIIEKGYNVTLVMRPSGTISTDTGNTDQTGLGLAVAVVQIDSIDAITGKPTVVSRSQNQALYDSIKTALVPRGMDLYRRLTNMSLREPGILFGADVANKFYGVPLSQPVGFVTSVKDTIGPDVLKGLISASNIRSNEMAIRRIISEIGNMRAREAASTTNNDPRDVVGAYEGVVSDLGVTPKFYGLEFDCAKMVAAVESTGVTENLSAALTQLIRDKAMEGIQRSNFQVAMELTTGKQNSPWKINVATSQRIKNYLMTSGDSRTFGTDVNFQLEADIHEFYDDRIIVTVSPAAPQPLDPLSPGWRLRVPELVTTVDTAPMGGTGVVNRAIVLPRERFVANFSVLMEIVVKNSSVLFESRPFIQVAGDISTTDVTPNP